MNIIYLLKRQIKYSILIIEKIPLKQETKLWIYHKPRGQICSHNDPQNRPTIFDNIQQKLNLPHLISVGRLDFNSEGLILITNDGDLSRVLEMPVNQLERTYLVRVFGRLNLDKLVKIRKGIIIKNIQYGPFEVDIVQRQTRNTWLRIKMKQGKNREIRRVMQKFSLRVSRLKRTKYGPYSLGNQPVGTVEQLEITYDIKRLLYLQMRSKIQIIQQQIREKGDVDIAYKQITAKKNKLVEESKISNFVMKKY